MDLTTLRSFEDEVRKLVPGFRVAFKDKTPGQKTLAFFLRPFNPFYMTKFVSTFHPVVYFPSQLSYEAAPRSSFTVLAHELVHLLDTQSHPLWFRLSYLLPQVFAIVPLAVYVALTGWRAYPLAVLLGALVLGCALAQKSMGAFWASLAVGVAGACTLAVLLNGWLSIPLFVGLALLAPWPAPGRVHWELRGYGMNLAITMWMYGIAPNMLRAMIVRPFIRSDYYFMSWSRARIEAAFDRTAAAVLSQEILKDEAFRMVHDFLLKNGQIHG